MLGHTRECRGCGIEFVQERAGQRYHDPACQIRSNNAKQLVRMVEQNRVRRKRKYDEKRPWREFVCENCGETARTQEIRPRRFCSARCKNVLLGREWQKANKERVREYHRANRARFSEGHKAYYHANRERLLEYGRGRARQTRSSTPWITLIAGAKTRAKAKGLPFDLTEAWVMARWTGACELTGIPFQCGLPRSAPRTFGPTIDRIIPSKGYTQDNCRFILHGINALKGEGTDATMYELASALLSKRQD